jgi:hypothetical protein
MQPLGYFLRLMESPRLRALKSAPLNSWIALSNDEASIIAAGDTYEELSKKIEASGISDFVVLKTPASWTPLSV